jgi:hypothetical protein
MHKIPINMNYFYITKNFVMPKGKHNNMSVGFVWLPSVITADASPYWLYSSFMLLSENKTMMYFDVQKHYLYELSWPNSQVQNAFVFSTCNIKVTFFRQLNLIICPRLGLKTI